MARNDRRRSRQWHFSDSGSRFDARRRYQPTIDHDPISKTFTRKIFHCKRCKNRVVSNVSHCPFCGKNLLPVYRRFWFWLIIVVAAGVAAGALVFLSPPIEDGESRVEIPPPLVVGAPEGSPIKDLDMGTTVDCNSLLVTVMESLQGPIASDGKPITAVKVQFLNKNAADAMLYSTQWQLETAGGERIDCYIGRTEQGENIISDLDSQSLAPDASLTVTLYFAADAPARVVFAPNALSYSESGLVTWLLSGQGDTTDATGAESGTDATEGS